MTGQIRYAREEERGYDCGVVMRTSQVREVRDGDEMEAGLMRWRGYYVLYIVNGRMEERRALSWDRP